MFSLVHVSDPRFGGDTDLECLGALVSLMPDLEPRLVIVSGDLSTRARHGEFQAARVWIRELERTAPVYVIPGDHDVEWWRRPLVPYGRAALYRNYARYFGPVLTPTLQLTDVVVTGVLTAHGVSVKSLTTRSRDIGVTGHVRRADISRAAKVFRDAAPEAARVLVMHHNVLRGASGEMGVTRWRQVHRWIMDSEADVVLCGHEAAHKTDVMGGIVISCAGAISKAVGEAGASSFHRIRIDGGAIQVELYEWSGEERVFKRAHVNAYARQRVSDATAVAVGVV